MTEYENGFSSNEEAWAVIKRQLEIAKKPVQAAEKLHKEMWDEITDGNDDGFTILANELSHAAANAVTFWMEVERLARTAACGGAWPEEES